MEDESGARIGPVCSSDVVWSWMYLSTWIMTLFATTHEPVPQWGHWKHLDPCDLAKASSETSEEEVEVKHVSIQPRRGV